MSKTRLSEKYSDARVVGFWREMSLRGLQAAEAELFARFVPADSRILDLGCGAGRVALSTDSDDRTVVGLDLTWAMVRTASALLRQRERVPRLVQADLTAIPCADGTFPVVLMFVGPIQHVPSRGARRMAFREIARVLTADGVSIVAVDNVAHALVCYPWWAVRAVLSLVGSARSRAPSGPVPGRLDRGWTERPDHVRAATWHIRGLLRTLRWRTWAVVVDGFRLAGIVAGEPGDTRVAQVSMPSTPGRVPYHLYRRRELVDDASRAGLRLLACHSASELVQGRVEPSWIRTREKEVFYVFRRT